MKNFLIAFLIIFLTYEYNFAIGNENITNNNQNPFQCHCVDEAIRYKNYISTIQKGRAILYNALDLTDEQIKYRENIITNNSPTFDCYFNKLLLECYRYKALKSANVNYLELNNQKKVIEKIKRKISSLLEQESNDFRKCLTKDQKTRYYIIKKLEKHEYKTICKKKDYFKSNPRMRYFGNLKKDCCTSCKSK